MFARSFAPCASSRGEMSVPICPLMLTVDRTQSNMVFSVTNREPPKLVLRSDLCGMHTCLLNSRESVDTERAGSRKGSVSFIDHIFHIDTLFLQKRWVSSSLVHMNNV